jgi:ATP synthase protein I
MGTSRQKPSLGEQVSVKARRKLKARRIGAQGLWFGVSLMGLIGWSVSIPTLLGIALGVWLDGRYPGSHSWTLACLAAGLSIGCLLAWHWVAQESENVRREQENDHE